MVGGRQLGTGPAVWVGLLALCGELWAEAPARLPNAPQPPSAKVYESADPDPPKTFYFGVMGQIARPGVYELNDSQPQVVDLIRHAGGLTRKATNQIRIVRQGNAGQILFFSPDLHFPLAAGDIVVADAPRESQIPPQHRPMPSTPSVIQTADFADVSTAESAITYRHVALIEVWDRPVILPVPETHANVPAILAYLGQAPALAPQIKVVPVGSRSGNSTKVQGDSSNFRVPTVLYFPKGAVEGGRLPVAAFPDVYRVESQPLTMPEERQIVENTPTSPPPLTIPPQEPTPVERFQRPLSEPVGIVPPPPAQKASEPPLIAKVRDLENRIPDPKPVPSPKATAKSKSAPQKPSVAKFSEENPSSSSQEETSPWVPIGLAFLIVVVWGTYAKLRWGLRPRSTSAKPIGVRFPSATAKPPSQAIPICESADSKPAEQSESPLLPDEGAGNLVCDEVLTALIYNQLPVCEEPGEPTPKNRGFDKPEPQKTFRMDAKVQQDATRVPKPFIMKRPKPAEKSISNRPMPSTEPSLRAAVECPPDTRQERKEAAETEAPSSLLDRVLQQVNRPRAA